MKFAIVAYGPNSVCLPCLFFKTREEAEGVLDNCPTLDRKGQSWYCNRGFDLEATRTFFTSYYGGCGGVNAFRVVELKENTPMFVWDLD